jgi:hypothetical protein
VRRYRIFRPVDNDHQVLLDVDSDTMKAAGAFLDIVRNVVWPSPDKAQAKVGTPSVRIIDLGRRPRVLSGIVGTGLSRTGTTSGTRAAPPAP